MNFKQSAQEIADSRPRLWRFADYEFDELGRELRVKGRAVEVESKPLDLLLKLLLHAGEVVTKEELIESVWGMTREIGENTLDVFMHMLRKKVDGSGGERLIQTVRGVGYTIRAEQVL